MGTMVAIGAHHDDVELRCGGTLAKYVRLGWDVAYVVATTTPHYYPWPEEEASGSFRSNAEAIELRKDESRCGASVLGITDVSFLDFKSLYWYKQGTLDRRYLDGHGTTIDEFRYLDQDLPGREYIVTAANCPAAVDFLCDFLAEKKPDVVLTHFPDDCHWEHYSTALFVGTAVRRLLEAGAKIKLYGWEQGSAGNLTTSFAPSRFVDISETIDTKCESLMCFVSQLPDHDPSTYAIRARKRAKEYGAMFGVEYAEPFMAYQLPQVSHMDVRVAPTYSPQNAEAEF